MKNTEALCYKPLITKQSRLFRFSSFQQKSLSRFNGDQKMRAKLGAKPFDFCQHHWTKMDTIWVTPALQLYEAASR
jgi:hypothetical protein